MSWRSTSTSALLEVTRHRLTEAGLHNCDFVAGDAYDIARLWTRPVDFVFLANAFHGVPDQSRLARSVRDALKPSGRFAIVNWHPRAREETTVLGEPRLAPNGIANVALERTIKAAEIDGLKFHELVDVPPYHYAVVLERV